MELKVIRDDDGLRMCETKMNASGMRKCCRILTSSLRTFTLFMVELFRFIFVPRYQSVRNVSDIHFLV